MEKLNFTLKEKNSKKAKARRIEKIRINGRDEIFFHFYRDSEEHQFNPETHNIMLGGKIIEPWLSYAINSWNVMLPYITYGFNKEQVERYLESIAHTGDYFDEA
jgi:hypothetical protein